MTSTMRIRLDHYNIRTRHLGETIGFYREVIGLREGPLPSGRPGAWMHDDTGHPVVHITAADAGNAAAQAALDAHLGARDAATLQGSGAIDHVAFVAPSLDDFRSRVVKLGLPFQEREVPQFALKQMFLTDPNGITVEINFHVAATERSSDRLAEAQPPA